MRSRLIHTPPWQDFLEPLPVPQRRPHAELLCWTPSLATVQATPQGIGFYPKGLLLKSLSLSALIHQCRRMDVISVVCYLSVRHRHRHPPPVTQPCPPGRPLIPLGWVLHKPTPPTQVTAEDISHPWTSVGVWVGESPWLAMSNSGPSQLHPVQPTQANTCIGRCSHLNPGSSHPKYPIIPQWFWSLWYFQLFILK